MSCRLFALVVATTLVPASAMGMASAELYKTQAYTYGRFDARIQFAPGDGVVSAFFLWKEGSDAANAYWNELDYEKVNADCHMQTNNIYGKPKANHQQNPTLSTICTAYHDYRFEWTPTYIAWVVDGKEIRRDTGADATAYAQNASGGMTFHFNIWPGNSSFGGNINNTTLPVHQYISWVEYSSYDSGSGNFTVQWHEDFQASGVPSGWAVGNWSSPYNLSTHSPQNVAFVNGIAELSLTADSATGAPATPPTDPSAGGTGGSGGSPGSGGTTSMGGSGAGGSAASGGTTSSGGSRGSGGSGSGGTAAMGGSATGGTTASAGTTASGGRSGSGGSGSGGTATMGGNGGMSASGGATSSGGTTGATSGGATGSGGGTLSPGSGGNTSSGGTISSGGVTSSATTTTGGTSGGGTTGSDGGCNCSIANRASPLGPAPLILFLVISLLRLRRKKL